jgi:hypothetical protein
MSAFGQKPTFSELLCDVRFTLKSGHRSASTVQFIGLETAPGLKNGVTRHVFCWRQAGGSA